MATKTRWSGLEIQQLVERAVELQLNDPLLSTLQAIRNAQSVLPPNRRRDLNALHRCGQIPALMIEFKKHHKRSESTEAPEVELAPEDSSHKQIVVPDTLEHLIKQFAKQVGEIFADGIQEALERRALGILQRTTREAVHSDVQVKRSVLITGPKQDQAAMLEKEFGKLLDLRILDKDHVSRAATMAKSVDHVLLWTNFTPHSIQDSLPREKLIFVNGGMDAIRAKLEELYKLK